MTYLKYETSFHMNILVHNETPCVDSKKKCFEISIFRTNIVFFFIRCELLNISVIKKSKTHKMFLENLRAIFPLLVFHQNNNISCLNVAKFSSSMMNNFCSTKYFLFFFRRVNKLFFKLILFLLLIAFIVNIASAGCYLQQKI